MKLLLLALGALLLVAAVPKEEPGEICRDSIEGSWDQVWTGRSTNPRSFWIFRKGRSQIYWFGGSASTMPCQYKIDFSRSPHAITFDDNTHGIFIVTGDTMTLCLVETRFPLPTDFIPREGVYFYVLKRKPR